MPKIRLRSRSAFQMSPPDLWPLAFSVSPRLRGRFAFSDPVRCRRFRAITAILQPSACVPQLNSRADS
jgi:hypothetical protein